MELYSKNDEYSYHYIEPETGYSLLYSRTSDSCVTLDPIATVLWKESGDVVDLAVVSGEFVKVFDIDNALEYMPKIVHGMCRSGILVRQTGQDQDQEKRASDAKKTSEYPLETINFYVTEECNARCYHCYQQTKNVGSRALPVHSNQIDHKTFLSFVKKAIPLGLRSVKLSGGEPLLRADIEDIVRGLRTLGLSVCIESNGFLITERLADFLAREANLVAISLDAGSATRHDTLRRLPGSYDRATKSMRMLSSRGGKVQAIMTLSRLNVSELEDAIAAAKENGCNSFKINILVTLGGALWLQNNRALLDMKEILKVYREAREWESKYSVSVTIDGPPCFASIRDAFKRGVGACRFTHLLGVLANGALSYCGIGNSCTELVFGNIQDNDFDINRFWQEAPALLAAREALSNKVGGVCSRCVFEASCKGSCRAFAYSEYRPLGYHSLREPHPWCQKAFDEGLFPAHYLIPASPN